MLRAALLLAALFPASTAWAGDLQGTWVLDPKSSDSLDPLLKAQGVSWVKRQAVDGLQVTQTLTRAGDQVTLRVVSSASTQQESFSVDGQERTVEGDKGTMQVTHRWDGDVLVTVQKTETPDGTATVTTRREASDDGTRLTQRITLQKPDGVTISVDRVFRKP